MNKQQKQIAEYLERVDDWVNAKKIMDDTGVKAPRMIVYQLREMGYIIYSHQAGQNSKGYLFASAPFSVAA